MTWSICVVPLLRSATSRPTMRHLLKKTILNIINNINRFFPLTSGPLTSKKPPLNGGHHAGMGSSNDFSATWDHFGQVAGF
jgi:hypothetical protein